MPTSYTSLLGLALPVTGELSGTWGDTVNDYITQYLDASVAGTQTISGSQTAVTLSKTTNAALSQAGSGATGSSQYLIINCTGNPAGLLTITAPAASKPYIIINATSTSQSVKIVGAGPTTGVTLVAGEKAVVAWDGSDFVKVASTVVPASSITGTLGVANGGTGQTTYTDGQLLIGNSSGNTLTKATLTQGSGVTITNGNGSITISATGSGGDAVLANNNAFTGANTFYNNTGQTFGTGTAAQDGIILAGRAGGTGTFRITLRPATLASNTTLTLPGVTSTVAVLGIAQAWAGLQTFTSGISATGGTTLTLPNVTDTLATIGTAQTFTAAQTFRAANAIRSEAASTQDAVVIAGRAGGTSSYAVTLTPATLSSSTTLTLPNVTSTVAVLGAAQTFTATQTFAGSSSTLGAIISDAAEVCTVSATAATGTINYDVTTQSVLFYTSNASANWTVNFRGSSGTSLNTLMSTGQSLTVAFLVTQGSTAYYNSAVQIDGSSVTPKWQGGTAPTAGNASGIDAYVYTIIKTASATFTVLASQTRFA